MKTIYVIVSIALLLAPIGALSQTSPEAEYTQSTLEVTFYTTEPFFEEANPFTSIELQDDSSRIIHPGYPQLPILSKTIILPFGSTIESVTYTSTNPVEIGIQTSILPVPQPIPVSSKQEPTYVPDVTIYTQNTPFPDQSFEVTVGTMIQAEKHLSVVTVQWYPIRYIPSEQKILYTAESTVELTISNPVETSQTTDTYDLLIIAPNEYQSALQPLVSHKNDHGVETLFASVESILDQTRGRDDAEKIKYYIYDASEEWGIKYVLLIGNFDKTPMRRSAIPIYQDEDILTDLYYADIYDGHGDFSSWDSNNNNKFSEYSWDTGLIDTVDAYPDLYVGRLPCNNTREVQTMVDKIITYEAQTSGSSWYHRLLLLAGDTFPNHGVIEGELVTGMIADSMEQYGFEPVKLWTSLGTFGPLNINKQINKGAGFISYSGHGYEQGLGTSPPNVEQRIEYFSPYLYGIFNGDKLPVIFFDACSTTKLDFTIEELLEWYPTPLARLSALIYGIPFQMDSLYPCFTWEIVKKVTGGGIAAIGSTRVAFTGVDEDGAHWGAGFLNTHFFQAYEPGSKLGELMNQAQIDYINSVGKECITLEEFILVGDPSLKLGGY